MQVSDWFEQVGDVYLNKKDLGSSLAMANALRDEQVHFERQARVCIGLRTSVGNTITAIQPIELSLQVHFQCFEIRALEALRLCAI